MARATRASVAASRRVAVVAGTAAELALRRLPLLTSILAQGHRLMCLAPTDGAEDAIAVQRSGAQFVELPAMPAGLPSLSGGAVLGPLRDHLAAFQPNALLALGLEAMLAAGRAGGRAGVQRIVLGATSLCDLPERPGLAARWGIKRCLMHATAVVAHNTEDAARLTGLGVLPRGLETTVVPGAGVDLHHFTARPLPRFDDGLVFTMIAARRLDNGILEFCQAAQRVKLKAAGARFVLATHEREPGADLDPSALSQHAGAVEIIEAPRDTRGLLEATHVLVMPSWGQGHADEVVEALATGRPAITTTAAGCRGTVDERVSGMLVPPRDAGALAGAMESFLRRPDLMAWMSQAARLKAERRFDARGVNQTLARLLGLDRAS